MSEREEWQKQYAYHAMSNKVERADRSGQRRSEPTGEAESLRGRRDIGRMGDRVVVSAAPSSNKDSSKEPLRKKVKTHRQQEDALTESLNYNAGVENASSNLIFTSGPKSVLDMDDVGSAAYQPQTTQARAAYESILTLLSSNHLLGSAHTPSVLRDATQETIAILKDDYLKDPEKHGQLSKLLTGKSVIDKAGALSSSDFTRLVQYSKLLDDYHQQNTQTAPDDDDNNNNNNGAVDDEMGVAVVFEESEPESEHESDVDADVVIDASSDSDSEGSNISINKVNDVGTATNVGNGIDDVDNSDQAVLVQGGKDERKKLKEVPKLSVHEIDAHFLQRNLSKYFKDANESAEKASQVLEIIDIRNNSDTSSSSSDVRECENKLLMLLGFEVFDTIKLILHNRVRIWAAVSMKRAKDDAERQVLEQALLSTPVGREVWKELHATGRAQDWTRERMKDMMASNITPTSVKDEPMGSVSDALDAVKSEMDAVKKEDYVEVDLDLLAFKEGSHVMSNKSCELPQTSWRAVHKGYEEVHVPAISSIMPKGEKLVAITDLPTWAHSAFKGMTQLNRIQSKMYDVALRTSENLLLCAPTGAGKTNVACLTMLNVLGQYRRDATEQEETESGKKDVFDLSSFKIVYVAPMKALVQEVVKNFSERLSDYGVVVKELSGDSSLTRQQIAETQLLVTTPEKWDIVTRQGEGRAFTQLVKLVIIDEIHLLHDERGPVLESIVARVIRQVESNAEPVRLVGLSATLPNYTDVAAFLRVNPEKGLFFFDNSYRPVPLQMQYVGITEKNSFRMIQLQNEICYEKSMDQRRNGHQVLIFVHSRADTGKTAKALRDMASEKDELFHFVSEGGATQEILRDVSKEAKNPDLRDVLPYGFAIHHAGMTKEDRELVEDLFASRHVAVLCTTATLAWGVNLPAHAVIIKGTQVYDPSKGKWTELSSLDVLQMLGRAGRPQFDREGEGIIITQHSELQYYLSLTTLQLPVESQLVSRLPDQLNAEIVLGTVQSIEEAVEWLEYTFLYVRMVQNPTLYGIGEVTLEMDPVLKQRRGDFIYSAALALEKSQLVQFERKTGALQSTPLGRVASQFYISHTSMSTYNKHMRSNLSDIELLGLFARSGEFSHMTVREEEKLELEKLSQRVPFPIKEIPTKPTAKVNMLLQAYISRLKLEGFALAADMAFIQQSAARIMRALFEIALRRKWAALAKLCLDFSNMVAHRMWRSQSPLRQFPGVPEVVARKLERKSDIEWSRYTDLTPSDLGELVGVPKMGGVLHKLVQQFPTLDISAQTQPISQSLLRIELSLIPSFQYDVTLHGYVQLFHIFIEDVNGQIILHHELFSLRSRNSDEEHLLICYVPILDPMPPVYFIRVISDRWLHSTTTLPISFSNLILPSKFPPPTELLDLQPLLPSALGEPALAKLFPYSEFNPIQTQVFHELFKTDRNCLICGPPSCGKTQSALFAVLRMFATNADGRCVYIAPSDDIADVTFRTWELMLGKLAGSNVIGRLSGDANADARLLVTSSVSVCSIKQWDSLSRRWKQKKAVKAVTLLIFDDLQFLGSEIGPILEVVISRCRYINQQLGESMRFVGLSTSLANARDVGEWMGVSQKGLFNFSPRARPMPLETYFHAFEQSNYSARLLAMAKPLYSNLTRHLGDKSVIVFVPSRRQAQLSAIDIMTYHQTQGRSFFTSLENQEKALEASLSIGEPALQQVVAAGIGFLYAGMRTLDREIVTKLFDESIVRVLVCPVAICWTLRSTARLVMILGTEFYDGREGRHVDYPIVNMLRMIGHNDHNVPGKCIIFCHSPKLYYLKKLLNDPLPIESHLDSYLHDPLNAEIVSKTVTSMQDAIDYLTWTFLYRRLAKNPTYYGLQSDSTEYISEHLSEIVETVVGDLEQSKCCQMTEDGQQISPLNLGMIAAYYYVQYRTIELIASSLTPTTKLRGILDILAASWEFSNIPIRYGEELYLKTLARTLYYTPPANANYDSNMKAYILMQCHFSRKVITNTEMKLDLEMILKEAVTLVQAIVDVISSSGWLKPALAAMELSQMLVQGLWNKDNILKQIPHFNDDVIKRCTEYNGEDSVETIFDILSLDEDVRNKLLQLPAEKMADVAEFCNSYPNVEMQFKVIDSDDVVAGGAVQIEVELERDIEDELDENEIESLDTVSAPLFPTEKKEAWWVVVGDMSTNNLLALKRVAFKHKQMVVLEFLAPEDPGDYDLKLFCMCDSYLGCDQEYTVSLSVANDESDEE